ncbi:MAG: molybdenum cofactor guanylyltransferase [Deltaproteobacteria bacterium]|nr:molybdenum cofactor guanylyltransferase [Deltaproteobacteria bacterium]
MPTLYPEVTGVLLAGGRSRRFGRNKALAKFQDRLLIERVFSVLQALFSEIIVVTNTPEEYRFLPARILCDERPYQGPLGGIATALKSCGTEQAFVAACDMPLLSSAVIRAVVDAGRGHAAAVPCHDQGREYLMALYSKSLLPKMREALDSGIFSLREFCARVEDLNWVPIAAESAANVNTPEELRRLEERYAL